MSVIALSGVGDYHTEAALPCETRPSQAVAGVQVHRGPFRHAQLEDAGHCIAVDDYIYLDARLGTRISGRSGRCRRERSLGTARETVRPKLCESR
ncbi:hypothetical protein [Lentzea guizhouensis]|uniref:hypothetical protein n=1 Tax=Lentzea guizhouensis TaxID=1586287 RepID=UPI0014746D73|nr:hypothetical protein [Lentzea guizhouensis]